MAAENELERLEEFVAKLLSEYNGLRKEKYSLLEELQKNEEKITALEEELAAARMERSDVGNRVKGLIQQIEDWESTLGENQGERSQNATQESRMQRNLFSVEPHEGIPSSE